MLHAKSEIQFLKSALDRKRSALSTLRIELAQYRDGFTGHGDHPITNPIINTVYANNSSCANDSASVSDARDFTEADELTLRDIEKRVREREREREREEKEGEGTSVSEDHPSTHRTGSHRLIYDDHPLQMTSSDIESLVMAREQLTQEQEALDQQMQTAMAEAVQKLNAAHRALEMAEADLAAAGELAAESARGMKGSGGRLVGEGRGVDKEEERKGEKGRLPVLEEAIDSSSVAAAAFAQVEEKKRIAAEAAAKVSQLQVEAEASLAVADTAAALLAEAARARVHFEEAMESIAYVHRLQSEASATLVDLDRVQTENMTRRRLLSQQVATARETSDQLELLKQQAVARKDFREAARLAGDCRVAAARVSDFDQQIQQTERAAAEAMSARLAKAAEREELGELRAAAETELQGARAKFLSAQLDVLRVREQLAEEAITNTAAISTMKIEGASGGNDSVSFRGVDQELSGELSIIRLVIESLEREIQQLNQTD
mmetsp:Transcript_3023/g.4924  ORF Transcript_3023/g.4924 Transcript_3023/m.4924 type:complete len:493 (-) Transcript_3023:242-1720(-)